MLLESPPIALALTGFLGVAGLFDWRERRVPLLLAAVAVALSLFFFPWQAVGGLIIGAAVAWWGKGGVSDVLWCAPASVLALWSVPVAALLMVAIVLLRRRVPRLQSIPFVTILGAVAIPWGLVAFSRMGIH